MEPEDGWEEGGGREGGREKRGDLSMLAGN